MEARRVAARVAAEKPASLLSQRDSNTQADQERKRLISYITKGVSLHMRRGWTVGQMALLQLGKVGKPF